MGFTVFESSRSGLKVIQSSLEEMTVNSKWIKKTDLIIEGLANQLYIHLDINTPFGETVHTAQVENALAESLGAKRENFEIAGWHIQYVEDTNLGSNHRIFVDLNPKDQKATLSEGRDDSRSLLVAVEALGEMVMSEQSVGTFQFLCSAKDEYYSLLFLNGAPFHVLQIPNLDLAEVSKRILGHREFLLAQGKTADSELATFLPNDDRLLSQKSLQLLKPKTLKLGQNKSFPFMVFHLGLAKASAQKELESHNRAKAQSGNHNYNIRTQDQFLHVFLISCLMGLLVLLGFGIDLMHQSGQLKTMRKSAAQYTVQVKRIADLRKQISTVELSLANIKPLWNSALDWKTIFSGIASALPLESGLDGVTVNKQATGDLELSFRAWVKDWNRVQDIQKNLLATQYFKTVSLSEQKKDLASGVVVFHITCILNK